MRQHLKYQAQAYRSLSDNVATEKNKGLTTTTESDYYDPGGLITKDGIESLTTSITGLVRIVKRIGSNPGAPGPPSRCKV